MSLATGTGVKLEALEMVFGGEYTLRFWVLFFLIGLLIPVTLNIYETHGGKIQVFLSPVLVLFGGYMLRQVTVDLGQASTWTDYASQFDPALLELLR